MLAIGRRSRIFVSLFTGALLLAVGMRDALGACASSPLLEARANAGNHSTAHHASPGAHPRAPESDESSHHRTPAHCPMPASCAVVSAVPALVVSVNAHTPTAAVAGADDAAPLSLAITPEPPPPRG